MKICKIEFQTKGEQQQKKNLFVFEYIFNKSILTFHFETTLLIDLILVSFFENTWNQRNMIYDQGKYFIF